MRAGGGGAVRPCREDNGGALWWFSRLQNRLGRFSLRSLFSSNALIATEGDRLMCAKGIPWWLGFVLAVRNLKGTDLYL
jgi:hypothetical protein